MWKYEKRQDVGGDWYAIIDPDGKHWAVLDTRYEVRAEQIVEAFNVEEAAGTPRTAEVAAEIKRDVHCQPMVSQTRGSVRA